MNTETYQALKQAEAFANAEIQRQFDAAVDAHDMPSGATKQPDPYTGD